MSRHRLTALGEPVAGQPPVEHAVGVVHLAVPHQVDRGRDHGLSLANAPGALDGHGTGSLDVTRATRQVQRGPASIASPSARELLGREHVDQVVAARTARGRGGGLEDLQARLGHRAVHAAGVLDARHAARRAPAPPCAGSVCVSRLRECARLSASCDIRSVRSGVSESRTSTSYSCVREAGVALELVLERRRTSRAVPPRNERQCVLLLGGQPLAPRCSDRVTGHHERLRPRSCAGCGPAMRV